MNEKLEKIVKLSGGTKTYVPHPGVWQFFDDELQSLYVSIIRDVVETVKNTQNVSDDFEWSILNNYDIEL